LSGVGECKTYVCEFGEWEGTWWVGPGLRSVLSYGETVCTILVSGERLFEERDIYLRLERGDNGLSIIGDFRLGRDGIFVGHSLSCPLFVDYTRIYVRILLPSAQSVKSLGWAGYFIADRGV
jgi:hypothetical protein